MKVIDLLNKIANGEDIPKKIKVNNMFIYEYENGIDYKTKDGTYLFNSYVTITKEDMNMEIEIIEDTPNEDKKIKRIQSNGESLYSEYIGQWLVHKENYSEYDELLMNKINEIIDKINGDK